MHCFSCKGEFPDMEGPTHSYILATPGCWRTYTGILAYEYDHYSDMRVTHMLTVDTYALQHPGEKGKQSIQSVWTHLVSLYFSLQKDIGPDERERRVSHFLSSQTDLIWLSPPDFTGTVTVATVAEASDMHEHNVLVRRWARSVWKAWWVKHGEYIEKIVKKIHAR